LEEIGATNIVIDLFLASAIFFALVCLAETRFRRMLLFGVFSSMSIVLGVFAASATEEGSRAAWILGVNMMVAACALFLCDDAMERRIGRTDSSATQGLAKSMPILAGFSLVAFFELVNVPMSWGYRGGEMALTLLFQKSIYAGILSVLAWGLLTFALIRNFANLFWGPTTMKLINQIDLNPRERWALLVLSLLIVLPIW
jgi:NADH-quinone oxidoreductase subunit M